MPLYAYTAFDQSGKKTTGETEADTAEAARRSLTANGLFISTIRESKQSLDLSSLSGFSLKEILHMEIGGTGVKRADFTTFCRQFATLVGAGIPLVNSLDALIDQGGSKTLIRALKQIRQAVNEGRPLSAALANHPKIFSPEFINMVQAAEASGRLGDVLNEMADLMEARAQLAGQLRAALTYPTVMLVVGLGIVWFLLVSVVPKITAMFTDLGQAMPDATLLLLAISNGLQNNGLLILALLAASVFGLKTLLQTNQKLRMIWHKFLLLIPVYGPLQKRSALARITNTLSALLSAGVPIINALQIAKEVAELLPYKKALEAAAQTVGEGGNLADALSDKTLFPPMVTGMVRVGEKSGRLADMLQKVATAHSTELKANIAALTSLIQPLLLLLMGGLIAFIMVAVLLPIFELNTLAGGL